MKRLVLFKGIKSMVIQRLILLFLCLLSSACATFKAQDLDYTALDIESKKRPLKYAVYTPPNWQKGEKLPLVLFLHGAGSTHESFERYGAHEHLDKEINAGRIPRAIVLIPRGGLSMWENWDYGSIAYRDWIVDDLIPETVKNYTTLNCPEHCHVIGTSMGGFGALRLAQLEADKFSSISTISGLIFSYEKSQRGSLLFQTLMYIPSNNIFGFRKNSNLIDPYEIWVNESGEKKPRLQLIWGDKDQKGIIKTNQDLHERLLAAGVEHDAYVYSGKHKWVDWVPQLNRAMNFVIGDAGN